ncbi:hypothetical protein O1611_g9769 [Lasiodiplodia mahajangana]|uniref:Uncharacterized protein n=1 Tax=Lasiodiplodia mahajangana TaxID=1108764 RepID=A0ACC2J5W8_9PEZI|nr:hypothetical protein O1611_g9769 [Lasiodiplodia mahajangana]
MSIDALSTWSDDSHVNEALQSLICPKCNVKYPNLHELLTHQRVEKHFACNKCDQCFWAEENLRNHKRNDHRPELDLECFGCQSHFNRAGEFWRHLESNGCKVIFPSDIDRLREKNLKFAQQLELRKSTLDDIIQHGESHIKGEHTWASEFEGENPTAEPTTVPISPARPSFALAGNAHPLHYRSEDFPVLPINAPVSAKPHSRGYQKSNYWSNNKATNSQIPSSASIAYSAVPPPVSYNSPPVHAPRSTTQMPAPNNKIRIMQAPIDTTEGGAHSAAPRERIVDPDHPDYNAAVFHNALLEKYVCPYMICGKKFNNAVLLTKHLRSPAHTGGRITCICCKKMFSTVASLISHMETAKKCKIRETDGFRRALGQITGGIMDFHIRSGMFTIDRNSVQKLFDMRSESTASPEKTVAPDSSATISKQPAVLGSTGASW